MAMNRSTLLTFTAFCLFNQLVHADMNSANAALARGDYAAASQEFLRLANDGNAKAQTHIGYMYYIGEGVQQDYAEANRWYRKAAVQGEKDAQYNLAVAYAFGEGTKQDYKEAAIWYRRAAEQGHVIAQYSLGISYAYGEGVKQDSVEAVKWFQLSADQGYARAQVQLASKYHTGDGVALNYEKAVHWYRQAADRGDAAAQYNLGSMFRSGKGVSQDYNQAVRWYRLAADQGYAAATNELASLERAIAGATRSRSQPQPAPVTPVAKAPAEEPLVTVKKSDLLVLDEREAMAESEPATDPVADTYEETQVSQQMQAEEEEPGRVSGFFKKIFKKKDTKIETAMVAETEPESLEEMQEAAVPVEDISEPMPEPDSIDEVVAEPELVTNEPTEKKPRFGFFKKLFNKKDPAQAASVEDRAIDDIEADSVVETEADPVVADGAEEVAEVGSESSAGMDVLETEAKPRKKGFFKRLFGKDKEGSENIVEATAEEPETMTTETVAMVDDSTENMPILEEEATMDALAVEEKPEKKGFFKRLFGKNKGDNGSADVDSASADVADSIETTSAEYPSESTFVADATELEAGQLALSAGNYDTAFNSFYDLAVRGDATAQYQLGLLHYQGLGTAQNYDEASHWYRSAAEQGHADAQYSLGNMFLMGEGVSQDDALAISWYEKAAEQGHVAARHNVDNLRRVTSNSPVPTDDMESALEHEQMEETLAETKEIVEDKPKKGFFKRLFSKKDKADAAVEKETTAAVQGPLPEMQSKAEPAVEVTEPEEVKEKKKGFLGRLFGKKEKEAEEMVEAEPLQRTAITESSGEPEQSFEEALTAVKEYEKGLAYAFGDGVAQDNKAAFQAFLASAELGHAPAQYKTGVAYAYGEGVDKDPGQAVYWYKKAAEQGNALAQRNLGVMYMNGDGVEQNKPLAFAWHSILADSGNVMDIHRRDSLQQQLSEAELEEARAIKATLKH